MAFAIKLGKAALGVSRLGSRALNTGLDKINVGLKTHSAGIRKIRAARLAAQEISGGSQLSGALGKLFDTIRMRILQIIESQYRAGDKFYKARWRQKSKILARKISTDRQIGKSLQVGDENLLFLISAHTLELFLYRFFTRTENKGGNQALASAAANEIVLSLDLQDLDPEKLARKLAKMPITVRYTFIVGEHT